MKRITANSMEGRVLLALRPGGMDVSQLAERIPTATGNLFTKLVRAGLIQDDVRHYRITAAGLAACPTRRDAKSEPRYNSKPPLGRSTPRKGAWS